MNIQCPHCQQTTELSFSFSWKHFACPKCHTLYGKNEDGSIRQTRINPANRLKLNMYISQQGVLDGERWEVVNATIKTPTSEPFPWQEFTLRNSKGDECFLSEYNGHWTLAKEVTDPEAQHDIRADYELLLPNGTYRLFHSSAYKTEYMAGFFEDFLPSTGLAKDFVSPPKAILLEKDDSDPQTYTFEARYVSQEEMKEAFPDLELPPKQGVGMLQPYSRNLINYTLILGTIGMFMIVYQLVFSIVNPRTEVFSGYVTLPDSVAEVSHVSPSFQYTGATGPIQIDLSAPVNNSWVAADFVLVNEETKAERYGTVEIAYYHGVEGGESWTEGSSHPSIKICGVTPGKYHLAMQIAKQPGESMITSLKYSVITHPSTIWNLLTGLIIFVLVFIGLMIDRSGFETNRWLLSDFPPETE
ncbi:MAG: hypothetical protein JNN28_02420 [Saprospiraceae bacterium]|nr:hypothetical protein [Saprospiraceae bacterium]